MLMKLGLAAWCLYVPRFRKLIDGYYIPVAGPDEDVITLSYESCSILRRNGVASSIKSLIFLTDKHVNGFRAALLADFLRLNNVKAYDVGDFYHLMNLAIELAEHGDVLVTMTTSDVAVSASMVLSNSKLPVEILLFNALLNTTPLIPNSNVRNDFHSELYLNRFSSFIYDALIKSSIDPKDIKYVATNIRDLKYCFKLLRNVGIGDKALEPSRFVSNYGYFSMLHSIVSLIRSLEMAYPGDHILYLDIDRNYNYFVLSVLKVNEDLRDLRGCVSTLDKLLNNSSVIMV